ncbi:F-box/LRR-repeat protein At3g60040-like [Raphanus sativus]|uniref:F-box/LRR-repeat protein At3g60040-like n=1 Tax=Raphanus sativus TaxID=3726 RepID=A0A6J0NZ66_RAPSA|nr:F-box/LRR-repeat protein At3g60040-like [Raphanus sativus]
MDSNKLGMGSRDAISCLPQEILGEILSLLPTKLAASTSLVSKRWRYLFARVHNLDLDDSVLLQPPPEGKISPYGDPIALASEIKESFRNFVDRTLALQCGSPINKFSLSYHVTNNSDVVNVRRWISNVVERGVLEVDFTLKPYFRGLIRTDEVHGNCYLPYHLFRSKTLVKLFLGTDTNIGKLPPDVYLPALKTLFLDTIVFDDQDLCDVLLPCCPVLEELTFNHTAYFNPYRISSQSIKKLTAFNDYDEGIDHGPAMSYDAPSLVSLDYTDFALSSYPLVNFGSLVEAKLDLSYCKEKIKRPDLSGLLVGISNVEILHLSPGSADVISRCVKHGLVLPVFKNIVKLSFGSNNKRGWKLLPYLLKQSPKLETLIIQGLDSYTGDVTFGLFQVKVLDVLGYRGTAKELLNLKSLLAGTECIPKVRVEFPEDVVVDHATIIQTHRDLFTLAGVVPADIFYFE